MPANPTATEAAFAGGHFHTGDLAVVWPSPHYEPGDVVAYRIPDDHAGAGTVVIHRIVEESNGVYVLQGDNNDQLDRWTPTGDDVIGRRIVLVPKVGRVVVLARQPAVLASLLAGLLTTFLMLRSGRGSGNREIDGLEPIAEAPDRLDHVAGTGDHLELLAEASDHVLDAVGSDSGRVVPDPVEELR